VRHNTQRTCAAENLKPAQARHNDFKMSGQFVHCAVVLSWLRKLQRPRSTYRGEALTGLHRVVVESIRGVFFGPIFHFREPYSDQMMLRADAV
jgi:hypothetical protein